MRAQKEEAKDQGSGEGKKGGTENRGPGDFTPIFKGG